MNKNKVETRLLEAINNSLNDQNESLDTSTISRLRQRRVQVLESEQKLSWLTRARQQITMHTIMSAPVAQASVATLVAIFSISLVLAPGSPLGSGGVTQADSFQQNSSRPLSEMDVLMSNEDMEFLENLEIYEWLAAEYG